MPFIKPPNMIPNVDEDSVQLEFNLKQIDAPMPEAPWIKRCEHGINFTNHITKDGKDREKFRKFFEEKETTAGKLDKNGAGSSDYPSAATRLLINMVGETVSDRHKISLMEDSAKIEHEEDNCLREDCLSNLQVTEVNQTRSEEDQDSVLAGNNEQQTSFESYDSEEVLAKGA